MLPAQIQSWLADFDRDEEEPTEDYPASIRTRVFYVLDAAPHAAGVPQLRIDPMTVALRKDNSPGTIKRYAPHQIQTPAKYLRPSDLIILTRLSRRTSYSGPQADDDPADTLRRILATGRARWGTAEGPALTEGPERQGQITWITKPDASQQAALALDEGLIGVRLPAPWYVDPAAGRMGPVGLDLPQRAVTRLLNAPAIPPEAAAEVRAQLSRRMPAAKVPVPAELQPPEPVQATDAPASAADQRHAAQRSQLWPRIGQAARARAVRRAAGAPVLRVWPVHPAAQPEAAAADHRARRHPVRGRTRPRGRGQGAGRTDRPWLRVGA